jgi:hypothetical protein
MANKNVETRKTSVELPAALWKAAHVRAMDEGRDLKDVIASALELYLKRTRKQGGSR